MGGWWGIVVFTDRVRDTSGMPCAVFESKGSAHAVASCTLESSPSLCVTAPYVALTFLLKYDASVVQSPMDRICHSYFHSFTL